MTHPDMRLVPVEGAGEFTDDAILKAATEVRESSVAWANDPQEFCHLIELTPDEIRKLIAALRVQQPARVDAQPVEYVLVSDMEEHSHPGYGEGYFCTTDAVRSLTHPAPSQQPADDKLRLAVDALEPFAAFGRFEAEVAAQAPDANPAPDDSVFKHWSDAFGMAGPKLVYGDLRRAAHALAALKAPAATEKADV